MIPMFPNRQQGLLRLHFLIQIVGVLALSVSFTGLVGALWPVQTDWLANAYAVALCLLAASVTEFLSRPPFAKGVARPTRNQLTWISYRQCLVLFATSFCLLILDNRANTPGLVTMLSLPAICWWIFSSNRYGFHFLDRLLYSCTEKGFSNAVLIGPQSAIQRFWSSRDPVLPPGTRVVGYVGVDSIGSGPVGIPRLGRLDDLKAICQGCQARMLLFVDLLTYPQLVGQLCELTKELGVRSTWIEDVAHRFGTQSQTHHDRNFALVSQLREPLEDPLNRAIKRCFDLVSSFFGIVFLLPPAIVLVGIFHRLYAPGPLFYMQKRSGRNREVFSLFKFRSMYHTSDERFRQAERNDSRIFPGGQFLRKFSIDELPQLINVFLGQMSMVGPRPHPLSLDDHLKGLSREYRLRNLAKPGITGLAQCRGWRGETRNRRQIRNRVRFDIFYIRHWSFWLDLQIVVETTAQVIRPPRSAF